MLPSVMDWHGGCSTDWIWESLKISSGVTCAGIGPAYISALYRSDLIYFSEACISRSALDIEQTSFCIRTEYPLIWIKMPVWFKKLRWVNSTYKNGTSAQKAESSGTSSNTSPQAVSTSTAISKTPDKDSYSLSRTYQGSSRFVAVRCSLLLEYRWDND